MAFMSRVGVRDDRHSRVHEASGSLARGPLVTDTAFPLGPGPPGAPGWDSPKPEVGDKRLVARWGQAGLWQRTPCRVKSVLMGDTVGGQQLKSCRGRDGAWEGTFWKWSRALLASLVPSWREGGPETLPSASVPRHWGGSRVLRATVLVSSRSYSTTDGPQCLSCPLSTVTGPWTNLTLCQREGKAGPWME